MIHAQLSKNRRELIIRIPVEFVTVKGRYIKLNGMESQVLDGMLRAEYNKEIGWRMHLTERTVKWYASRIFKKAKVQNRQELLKKIRWGYRLDLNHSKIKRARNFGIPGP